MFCGVGVTSVQSVTVETSDWFARLIRKFAAQQTHG